MNFLKKTFIIAILILPSVGCNSATTAEENPIGVFKGLQYSDPDSDNCYNFSTHSIKMIQEENADTIFSIHKKPDCKETPINKIAMEDYIYPAGVWNGYGVFYDATAVNRQTLFLVNLETKEIFQKINYEDETPQFSQKEITYYEYNNEPASLEMCLKRGISEENYNEFKDQFDAAEKRIFNLKTGKTTKHPKDKVCFFFQ